MKIIQIIPMFQLAGAETMCENLCYALREQGHEIIAVSLYTEYTPITNRLEEAGIRVVYLGKKRGLDLTLFTRLIKLFRREKPDVVHTHIYAAKYALPVAVLCAVPCKVHTVHNIAQKEQKKMGMMINKILFKYFNVIPVALSNKVKKTIHDVYNMPERKIPVVFNGVDLSKCFVKTDYEKKNKFTIIHIGRFMDVKNHELILRTFARFVKQYPDARLQLLGDGELKERMIELSKKLEINQFVEFAGVQSDVYPWLHNADVFILPSKYEGLPMTLIEAMGTGLPVIASRVGGVPDMLTDKENALLIRPDQDELYEALERLYRDDELRSRLGVFAERRSKIFSSNEMAKRYTDVYKLCV